MKSGIQACWATLCGWAWVCFFLGLNWQSKLMENGPAFADFGFCSKTEIKMSD
jgi:hypothetical protein